MVSWGRLDAELADYFRSKRAKNVREAAAFIAGIYNDAVRTAALDNTNPLVSFDNGGMEQALGDAFARLLAAGEVQPSPGAYALIADGIVAAWTAAAFSPDPPFPGLEQPTAGVVVTSGGDAASLSAGLYSAFTAGEESAVVSRLRSAFQSHLRTVSGTYIGAKTVDKKMQEQPPVDWVGVV